MNLEFGYKENAEEVGGGVSPFIEAPGFTLSYPDPDSFKAITSQNKGTAGIEFIMVEAQVTEGVDTAQYGGRRKCKTTIYFNEKSWNKVVNPLISKLGDHYFGKETADKILKACAATWTSTQDFEKMRDTLLSIFKQVFAQKKPAYFLYAGDASYKEKDDKSGYWRSVYPKLNVMGTTVRPNTAEGKKEMEEYFEKHKSQLLTDTGEPKVISSNNSGLVFNTDLGDLNNNAPSVGGDDDWASF